MDAERTTLVLDLELQRAAMDCHEKVNLSLTDLLTTMPNRDPEAVAQFLSICQENGWHEFAFMASIRYNHPLTAPLPHDWCVLLPSHFCFQVVKAIPNLVELLLERFSTITLKALEWAVHQPLIKEDLEAIQELVNNCSSADLHVLKHIVGSLYAWGKLPQLNIFLQSPNPIVRQAVMEHVSSPSQLAYLVAEVCWFRAKPDEENSQNECIGRLAAFCESGLFSVLLYKKDEAQIAFPTPLSMAVNFNQPDLVRFVYSIGVVSNKELFDMQLHLGNGTQPQATNPVAQPLPRPLGKKLQVGNDPQAARSIRSFLLHKASRPPSLQSLCLREVSRHIGWGHGRQDRVTKLEISTHLKDHLLFKTSIKLLKK